MNVLRRFAAALLATSGLALAAQEDPEDRANIGVRVHLQAPMGDLRNLNGGQNGVSAAGFVDIPLEEVQGVSLRPMMQFDFFPRGDSLGIVGNSTQVFAYMLALESLWYPNHDRRGPYLMAALGAQHWRISSTGSGPNLQGTKLGVNGGVGLRWNSHLSLEVKAFWSAVDGGVRATGMSAGFSMMF